MTIALGTFLTRNHQSTEPNTVTRGKAITKHGFPSFRPLIGANEENSTNHKGGVHLEEHHENYSNMTSVLKTIDVPDELDWRDYGKTFCSGYFKFNLCIYICNAYRSLSLRVKRRISFCLCQLTLNGLN